MVYSAYKLHKQGDNIQPWHTPFPIWNLSVYPCLVLTVASLPAYRLLRRQIRWSGIPISLKIFHSLLWSKIKGFDIVNKAEVDIFLELFCFFDDSTEVGNLISGSSAFSKSSSNIWKFMVHVLLKPVLENFEHYFASANKGLSSQRLWFFQWSCMDVRVGLWRKLSAKEVMLLNCGVGEYTWESLGLQGGSTSPF